MGTLLSAATSRLGKSNAIRNQVLLHIFIARNHNIIKFSYERYLNTARASSSIESDGPPKEGENLDMQQHKDMDIRKWDWRGFPARWRYFALYDFASTAWLIWVTVRSLFLDQLSAVANPLSWWLFDMPGNCLVPGRVTLPLSVNQLFSVFLTSFDLSWRFFEARATHNRLLTMVVFLLVSERDLEHFYSLLRNGTRDPRDKDSDVVRLLSQVMCYQVHGGGGDHDLETTSTTSVSFKLRPNRTREARRLLSRRMAIVSVFVITVSVLAFLALEILIVLAILSDYRYAHVYPGCTPLLDEQLAQGKLTLWPLSITLTNHHLISGIIDLIESNSIILDWVLAVFFVPAFCYILNYDLLLYWAHIDNKLKLILARESHHHNEHVIEQQLKRQRRRHSRRLPSLPIFRHYHHHYRASSSKRMLVVTSNRLRQLKCDIDELQHELYDFFQQVKCADLLIGDTLTMTIVVWLSVCAFVNYNVLVYDASSLTLIVKLILTVGFFVVSLATYHLLELRRRCMLTYRLLFALMACDRAHTRGKFFTRILDFYLEHDSTTYNLFRAYAYKPTTFLAIIGWSFSSFFVVFTLFGERRQDHGGGT